MNSRKSLNAIVNFPLLKMTELAGVFINAVMKKSNVIRVGQTAVFGSPTGAGPAETILQHRFKNYARDLAVRHQAVFVLVEIGLLVYLKVVQILLCEFIFLK